MRRIMTSTLALIFTVGTITTIHTSAHENKSDKPIEIVVYEAGMQSDTKKNTINRINELESCMKNETKDVCDEIEKKRTEYLKSLKENCRSIKERDALKAKYYSDNKVLLNKLDELRKPYIEEMKKIHKKYVDSLF